MRAHVVPIVWRWRERLAAVLPARRAAVHLQTNELQPRPTENVSQYKPIQTFIAPPINNRKQAVFIDIKPMIRLTFIKMPSKLTLIVSRLLETVAL